MRGKLRKPAWFVLLGGAVCLVGLLGWCYLERISAPNEPAQFEWFPRLPCEEALAIAHMSATSVGYKMVEYELASFGARNGGDRGWLFIFHRKSPYHPVDDGHFFDAIGADSGKIRLGWMTLANPSVATSTDQTSRTTQAASAPARATIPIRGLSRRSVEEPYACAGKALRRAGLDPGDYGLMDFQALRSEWIFRFVSRDDPYTEFDIEVPDWWWRRISGTPAKPRHKKAATTQEARKQRGPGATIQERNMHCVG